MDNKKNGIPKLRFPGFTGAWEQRKLGEVAEINPSSEIPDNFEYVDLESVVGTEMIAYRRENKKTAPSRAQRLAKKGDIFYQTVRPYQKNNYHFNLTRKDFVFSTGYAQLRPNINGDFLFVYIQLSNFVNEVLNRSTGTSYPAISPSNLIRMKVAIPTNNEQEKIGAFFKQLDSLIALHQRKLEHLQEQKKGLLQKMFPKNGETVPEVRFPGFTDAWEQRKLGEITSHRGGTAIEKYFDENGEYKVISIGSYGLNSKYVDQNIRAKSNEITNERVVHAGELTMVLNDKTANGTIIGRSLLIENDNEYVINQRTEIITPKENFNNKFAYTLLNGPFRNKVRRIVQGGTQIYVNYSSVEKLTVFLPNIKEQEKIAEFFHDFDSLIALHQRKLDHLELMKKGLLQQMFV